MITTSGRELHPVVAQLFETRGLGPSEIQDFLNWDLRGLPDLSLLDLDKASERIIEAIANGEQIGIYGDYDVDGTTSCALLHHFFKMLDTSVELIQPSRFIEGYGVHRSSIEKASKMGIRVLITVDCGITSTEAADAALEHGIDLIITDHHEDAAPEMPKAFAIVNPNRRDETCPNDLYKLAGVGVAFVLAKRVRELWIEHAQECPSIYPLLQFVAIGTIADLAPLNPMNLKLSRHGLKQLPSTSYTGLAAFLTDEEKALPIIPSDKIAFGIAPMINSKGRLDHPEAALRLLIETQKDEAAHLCRHLQACNAQRKAIQAEVFEQARRQAMRDIESTNGPMVIAYAPDWHEGVIGIVASKLVENFHRPALVFTNSEQSGIIKASGRSAGGLNLFELLNGHRELFERFGGHHAACGLSMKRENLNELRGKLFADLEDIPAIHRTQQVEFDLDIHADHVSAELAQELEIMAPFGQGNPRPKFRINGMRLKGHQLLKDLHAKWSFITSSGKQLQGISFHYMSKWRVSPPRVLESARELEVIAEIGVNHFRGRRYLQLLVSHIRAKGEGQLH